VGVQRLEALKNRDWNEVVSSRIADEPFDFALVVASYAGKWVMTT